MPTFRSISAVDERIGYTLSENHSRRHGRYLFRILMLLVRLRNMKLFAPLVLAAPLVTSNHLKGE